MADFITDSTELQALQEGPFRKATFSGAGDGCVDIAPARGGRVLMRDTKDRDAGSFLISKDGWDELLGDIKASRYDHLV